jgi:hypothetical protein
MDALSRKGVKGDTPIDSFGLHGCFPVVVYKNSQEQRTVTARNSVTFLARMADFLGKRTLAAVLF